MRHHVARFELIVLLVTLSLLATIFAPAAFAETVTTSLMVSVDGLTFDPGPGLEPVALSGRVHLVTQFVPPSPIVPPTPVRVFVNLADVTGTGLASGLNYVAIGAANTTFVPPTPISPQFTIMAVAVPPSPIIPGNPVMPITFVITLAFDDAGHLLADGTTVALPGCTTDICP